MSEREEKRTTAGSPETPQGGEEPREGVQESSAETVQETGREEGAGPGEAASSQKQPQEISELEKKAAERDRLLAELLRAKADFDNYRKRVERDRKAWEDQAVRKFIKDLLPVVDNFERALEHTLAEPETGDKVLEGVRLIYQLLLKVLKDHGVEPVEALGKPFDPNLHEAVEEVETTDTETGTVVEVLEKGYTHKGVLVRPSRVKVARKVEAREEEKAET